MKLIDSNDRTIKRGDLVAVKFVGGEWRPGGWRDNIAPSYYFATVADFRYVDGEDKVKVEWYESMNTNLDNPSWSFEDPKNLLLICNSRKLKRIIG